MRFRTGRARTRQLERPPRPDHPHTRYPLARERGKIQDALERVDDHFSNLATGTGGIIAAGSSQKSVHIVHNSAQPTSDVAQLQSAQKSEMPLIGINNIDSVSKSSNKVKHVENVIT